MRLDVKVGDKLIRSGKPINPRLTNIVALTGATIKVLRTGTGASGCIEAVVIDAGNSQQARGTKLTIPNRFLTDELFSILPAAA